MINIECRVNVSNLYVKPDVFVFAVFLRRTKKWKTGEKSKIADKIAVEALQPSSDTYLHYVPA